MRIERRGEFARRAELFHVVRGYSDKLAFMFVEARIRVLAYYYLDLAEILLSRTLAAGLCFGGGNVTRTRTHPTAAFSRQVCVGRFAAVAEEENLQQMSIRLPNPEGDDRRLVDALCTR